MQNTSLYNSPLFSIAIPIYNEEKNLYKNIKIIKEHAEKTETNFEILLIDDGSNDKSWEVINQLTEKFSNIKGIKLSRNFGKEASILCGLKESKGSAVIVIDSDLQHPPELIPKMIKIWKEAGFCVINAKKKRRQKEGLLKLFAVRLFYKTMNILSGMNLSDGSDYKLLDRKVVDAYLNLPETNRFFRALVPWIGFEQCTIEFEVPQGTNRPSRWSLIGLVKLSMNAILGFSAIPLRFVSFFGIITLLISILLSVQTLYLKLTGQALEGFTTVIISVLFSTSIVMLSLGIIGEYLAKIYDEVKNRPKYIMKDFSKDVSQKT